MRASRFALVIGLSACGGGQDHLHATRPSIALEEAIDFQEVAAGATKAIEVPVSNVGDSALELCVADDDGTVQAAHDPSRRCAGLTRLEPADGVFEARFDGADPKTGKWSVAVGQDGARARKFTLRFTPPAKEKFEAILDVVDDLMTRTTAVSIRGTGVEPPITLVPERLDFGDVPLRSVRMATVQLVNAGDLDQPFSIDPLVQTLPVFHVVPSGAPPTAESDRPLRGIVPARSKTTVDVWFTPRAERVDDNALQISYCKACVGTLSLRGRGYNPDSSTAPVDQGGGGGHMHQ
jgi:hypothetical protein